MSHHKNTRKFVGRKAAVCKRLYEKITHKFLAWKSTILYAIYTHLSAAMSVVCTVGGVLN